MRQLLDIHRKKKSPTGLFESSLLDPKPLETFGGRIHIKRVDNEGDLDILEKFFMKRLSSDYIPYSYYAYTLTGNDVSLVGGLGAMLKGREIVVDVLRSDDRVAIKALFQSLVQDARQEPWADKILVVLGEVIFDDILTELGFFRRGKTYYCIF